MGLVEVAWPALRHLLPGLCIEELGANPVLQAIEPVEDLSLVSDAVDPCCAVCPALFSMSRKFTRLTTFAPFKFMSERGKGV